jgi:acetate kinase
MNVLVLNAGSSSLKFEVIAARTEDEALNEQCKLVSGAVENIGEEPTDCGVDRRVGPFKLRDMKLGRGARLAMTLRV